MQPKGKTGRADIVFKLISKLYGIEIALKDNVTRHRKVRGIMARINKDNQTAGLRKSAGGAASLDYRKLIFKSIYV